MNTLTLALIGCLIIALLAGYALYLWRIVWKQQRKEIESQQARNQVAAGARENVTIMLRVLVQEQVSLTEAAIRIVAYSQALPAEERASSLYLAFDQLAKATAHIPILEQWQALSKPEQLRLEQERLAIEERHREAITTASNEALASPSGTVDVQSTRH